MLQIRLFGQPQIRSDETAIFLSPPRALSLLTYVLLHRHDRLARNALAFTFWPDSTEPEALAKLREHIRRLREGLPASGGPWLLTDARTVRWNPNASVYLDVAEYERLAVNTESAVEAVDLYTGDLAERIDEDWLQGPREHLRERQSALLLSLAETNAVAGNTRRATEFAQRLMRHDPWREDGVRLLIGLRTAAGDGAGARQVYRDFAERLRAEFNVEPAPETTAACDRAVAAPAPADPPPAARPAPLGSARRSGSWRPRLLAACAAVALAASAGALWFGRTSARSGPVPPFSLVVLPFTNIGGDPTQNYVAGAITEALTTYVSRIPGTFVIASTTAATYAGKPFDVRSIGRDLGVRYAIEGSALPVGKRVRVDAQLIDTATASQLWADQFDSDRTDFLQMQEAVVTRLAHATQVELGNVESARINEAHPANPGAEDLAMQCDAIRLNLTSSRAGVAAGYRLCERALIKDPDNVHALAVLGETYGLRAATQDVGSVRTADIRRSSSLLARALELDENSFMAHHGRAWLLVATGDPQEAIVEEEHSQALNPSYVAAYTPMARAYLELGSPDAAIAAAKRAIQLSPRDHLLYSFYGSLGEANFMLRNDTEATGWFHRAIADSPDYPIGHEYLSALLALDGHKTQAREMLARYLSLPDTRARTIAGFREQSTGHNALYLASQERLYRGLHEAGLPE